MRSFRQFLYRRKIKDVKVWCTSMNITSDLQLSEWCLAEDVRPPEEKYFSTPEPAQATTKKPSAANKSVAEVSRVSAPSDGETEPWHVPAAERPRRPAQPAKTKSKKNKGK